MDLSKLTVSITMLYCILKTQITNSAYQHVSEWDEVDIVVTCSLDVSSIDRLDDHNALQMGRSFRSESNELLGERQRTANNDGNIRCRNNKINSLHRCQPSRIRRDSPAFSSDVPRSREISRCPAFFENGIIFFFVADYSTCLPRNATK